MTRTLAVGIVVLFAASCTGPTSTTPVPTPVASITSLRIIGPSSVAPGQTVNFSAQASLVGGSTKDYTTLVTWSSNPTGILTVSTLGVATGIQVGDATLVAMIGHGGAQAAVDVLVVPTGTFRMVGDVNESGFGVPAATVTVTTGTGAGLSTTTDAGGYYSLYGVAGAIQVQVTKPGYNPSTTAVTVTGNGMQNFQLTPVTPEPNIAGTYAVTLSADPACAPVGSAPTALPADVRQRHYQATISEKSGFVVQFVLGGANFAGLPSYLDNQFSGRLTPVDVEFAFGDPSYYYAGVFGLAEIVGPEGVLTAEGTGTLAISAGALNGGFDGLLGLGPSAGAPFTASCSGHHAFVFTPQSGSTRIRR